MLNKAKIITITSVKGGTGKSTVVLNLAATFERFKKKVLIIDLDLTEGAIATSLNIDSVRDVASVLGDITNNCFTNINDYVTCYNEYISVLSSSKDPRVVNKLNSKYLSVVLSKASYLYDVILIDTNNFIDQIKLIAMDRSDEIFYVLSSNPVDLKCMRTMVSIYKDMGKENYKIILYNSITCQKEVLTKHDITSVIKHNIDYVIPYNFYIKSIDKYILSGQILLNNGRIRNKHMNTVKEFEKICNDILKED